MRIAVCSDEPYPVHSTLRAEIESRGHECVGFGAFESGEEAPWAEVAERAAAAVADGSCDEGVFLCWSGTGIAMAANKVGGIRAALCTDPGMARAAREWNHANVICLSNRLLSSDMAKEMMEAWFGTPTGEEGAEGVAIMNSVDRKWRRSEC